MRYFLGFSTLPFSWYSRYSDFWAAQRRESHHITAKKVHVSNQMMRLMRSTQAASANARGAYSTSWHLRRHDLEVIVVASAQEVAMVETRDTARTSIGSSIMRRKIVENRSAIQITRSGTDVSKSEVHRLQAHLYFIVIICMHFTLAVLYIVLFTPQRSERSRFNLRKMTSNDEQRIPDTVNVMHPITSRRCNMSRISSDPRSLNERFFPGATQIGGHAEWQSLGTARVLACCPRKNIAVWADMHQLGARACRARRKQLGVSRCALRIHPTSPHFFNFA